MKKILLHCCCAPCSSASIERLLADSYQVVLFYSNSNIYPREEYEHRLNECVRYAQQWGVEIVEDEYKHALWGGCAACFAYNLAKAEKKAKELGIEEFTTTLTVSPHKISQMIFNAAKNMAGYVPYNFKKQDGFKRSLQLSEKYGLYRQNYCGCEYSLKASK